MSYSHPSLMIIASRIQFHIERPWGQRPFSIVSLFNQEKALDRGLLRDYEPSDGAFSSTNHDTAPPIAPSQTLEAGRRAVNTVGTFGNCYKCEIFFPMCVSLSPSETMFIMFIMSHARAISL